MARYLAIIGALLTFGTAGALAAGPALTPVAKLDVKSDLLNYDQNTQVITATGSARIQGEVEGAPEQKVLIKAAAVEADLAAQTIHAREGVEFIIPSAYLAGETLSLDSRRKTFLLGRAEAVFNLAPAGQPPVLGQLRGAEIGGVGGRFYLTHGVLGVGDNDRVEVGLQARRLEYDPVRRRLKVQGGALRVYGLRIPSLFDFMVDLPGGRREEALRLPTPTYSARDGLVLPYGFRATGEQGAFQTTLGLRLTARRGITFLSDTSLTRANWVAEGWVSRMEDVHTRLAGNLVYDRLPEFTFTRYQYSPRQPQGWKLGLGVGNFYERDQHVNGVPEVHRYRGLAGAGYEWNGQQKLAGVGHWAEVWGAQTIYSKGEHYLDASVDVGAGRRFSSSLHGTLDLIHHFTSGATPFQFDRVDIATEVRPAVDLRLTRSWQVAGWGRYDAEDGLLRDYYVALSKRMHTLTWSVYYRFVGQMLGVRMDINGLTGNTPAPPLTSPLARRWAQGQQELQSGSPLPPVPGPTEVPAAP
ncbi:MAG TPA: hypothetical protein VGM19_05885 [Armatimonadota bacterium]|jgi:hypothetical protein